MSVWDRIKEHKVVQWTVAYAAAAYTLLHAMEMVSDALGWPHVIIRVLTLLLILGAPLAATLAWYHGHRAQHRVSGPELTIITVLLIIAGTVLWHYGRDSGEHATAIEVAAQPHVQPAPAAAATRAPEKSIAVLPFTDMSEKKDQQYFADGIAEELLDLLAKTQGLQVTARTSSFYFKDRQATIADIAKTLNVSNILQGSVRKSGSTVRVSTQLIRASDGVNLWSQSYDRDAKDVFKVQDEIATQVVSNLRLTLFEPASSASRTANAEAYNLYLQGNYFRDRDTEASLQKALDLFQQARDLDPNYAPAWAGIASTTMRQLANGYIGIAEGAELVRAAANKAIELDPTNGQAYASLGTIQMSFDYNWMGAKATLAKGREGEPNNSILLTTSAILARALGRNDEADAYFKRALEHDPVNLLARRYYGRTLFQAGRLDEAERQLRQVLTMNDAQPGVHYEIGRILLVRGEADAAVKEFEAEKSPAWKEFGLPLGYFAQHRAPETNAAVAALLRETTGSEFQVAETYAYMGNPDKAFEWLDAAIVGRDPGLAWLSDDPLLKGLVGDPRYPALLRKLRMPQ
ncbi:MAG TPA: tetratricopeptide repeat protein [Steroidobacteraceae bacterium]|nr:tetratricopeptide repeat protein [Steroidobacteraceae bacterium]